MYKSFLTKFANWLRDAQDRAENGQSLIGLDGKYGFLWKNPLSCLACHSTIGSFDWVFEHKLVIEVTEYAIIQICSNGMEPYEVCRGAVKDMGDYLVPSMLKSILSPKYFCSRMAGMCKNPVYTTMKS